MRNGSRTIGAYMAGPRGVRFVPAVDVSRIAVVTLGAAAVTAVAAAVRRRPVVGSIAMGPVDWVSLKRAGTPPPRDAAPRPRWAHVLRAHRLVPQAVRPVRTGTPALCRGRRRDRA
ncbi:hypothetical protein [Actinoplanes sp. NPDC049265]|uniref:hypothetical protein n=1 Tax=Actinoplanes sp. NPDC049265 TaxID=3363902 RepID=UPI0037224CE3